MRVTRLKSLTLPLLALVTFNMIPQLWLRPVNYTLLCGLFIGYRFTVELFGLPMPNRFIVTLMQVLSGILIWQDFQSLFGEGASGALLTLLTCLKTYELKSKRDYFVNCILCFLVLMSYLLLDQSLLLTAYLLADVALMLSFMYALESELWSWSNLKAYARPTFAMTLKSAPLLVLCFLLFPRFQTGFGAGQQAQAKMGMTDNLSPGAISKLAQSDELVFRASYVRGQPPAQGLRYYKGAILDVANGLNWERTKSVPRQQTVNGQSGGEAIEVYLEPGYERFLFVPENAQTAYFADETYKVYRREGNVFELGMPLKARERYFIFVNDEQVFEPASRDMERFLQVPGEPSDQMRRYLSRMKGPTTGQTVGNIVRGFREENGFVYTLEPPPADSIDQFMFRTRAGFCEHYAAATATMLRHLNIPSRVVTGFQGGDASFLENYVTVRNDDAHAWVEYYDDFSNVWRMIDPTSQVAPLRLSMGSDVLIQNGESWINWSAYYQFRSVIDEVDAAWVGFLLRFDLARQKELLSRFGMEAAVFRALPVFLLLAIVLTLAFLYFLEAQRREKLSREERLYRELLKTVQRETGFERRLSEGPVAWFERLQAEQPGIAPAVEPILEPLILARFGSGPIEKRAIDDVARQLKKLRAI
jgi:protein-glutamine gamma-glutamyltransferase